MLTLFNENYFPSECVNFPWHTVEFFPVKFFISFCKLTNKAEHPRMLVLQGRFTLIFFLLNRSVVSFCNISYFTLQNQPNIVSLIRILDAYYLQCLFTFYPIKLKIKV